MKNFFKKSNFKNMKVKVLLMFSFAALLFSCGDDHVNKPGGGSEVPKQILNPRVRNMSGGSVIYYDRPDDKNLRYVKAEYTTDDGMKMDATASFFTDSIFVQGFSNACTIDVFLYSVSASEVRSEPVSVSISPEKPPYLVAFDNLEILPTFLGVRAATVNETNAKLTVAMYKKNPDNGRFEEIGMSFLNDERIDFTVKGQDTIENNYMVKIRDQWGRWSDEKTENIKPWFEKQLDKSLFREVRLCVIQSGQDVIPDQTGQILPSNFWGHFMHWWSGSDVRFETLYDGRYGNSIGTCYHTRPTGVLPQHFTIDFGKPYTLSRIVIWGRFSDVEMGAGSNDTQHVFRNGFPKRIQLYGSTYTGTNERELQDDIDNPDYWVDLGQFILRRADGTTDMITGAGTGGSADFGTVEDRLILQRGHEFDFPQGMPQIRYFRFRSWELYNPAVNAVMLGEISLFGTEN